VYYSGPVVPVVCIGVQLAVVIGVVQLLFVVAYRVRLVGFIESGLVSRSRLFCVPPVSRSVSGPVSRIWQIARAQLSERYIARPIVSRIYVVGWINVYVKDLSASRVVVTWVQIGDISQD